MWSDKLDGFGWGWRLSVSGIERQQDRAHNLVLKDHLISGQSDQERERERERERESAGLVQTSSVCFNVQVLKNNSVHRGGHEINSSKDDARIPTGEMLHFYLSKILRSTVWVLMPMCELECLTTHTHTHTHTWLGSWWKNHSCHVNSKTDNKTQLKYEAKHSRQLVSHFQFCEGFHMGICRLAIL